MSPVRVVLFTRYPEPGGAKTRLIQAIGAEGAAAVHRTLAERTVKTLDASGLAAEIHITGADESAFREWLGADRNYIEQTKGDLGDRLTAAIEPTPVLFIGSDCPDLTSDHLQAAATALEEAPVVVGPAEDGGYWLIGLADRHDFLFTDMPWGTQDVVTETLARLEARSIAPAMLDTLADCDRPEDLRRWPWLQP